MPLASIPSPGRASWRFGPLPIHAYALCVVAGIIVALVVASRRYRPPTTNRKGVILDVAAWAVPFALVGAIGSVISNAAVAILAHAMGGQV